MKDGQREILWRVSLGATLTQLDRLGNPLARVYLSVAEFGQGWSLSLPVVT